VIVRQVVSSRTKRGVLRTSNRERVTKSYDEHQASYEKAQPIGVRCRKLRYVATEGVQ
jgi:hypothetical protein